MSTILSGHGIELKPYPSESIDEPGFYWNASAAQIEHWSNPCAYTEIMRSHFSNEKGLIQDGFRSVIGLEDMDHFIAIMINWNEHLKRYGVVQ